MYKTGFIKPRVQSGRLGKSNGLNKIWGKESDRLEVG